MHSEGCQAAPVGILSISEGGLAAPIEGGLAAPVDILCISKGCLAAPIEVGLAAPVGILCIRLYSVHSKGDLAASVGSLIVPSFPVIRASRGWPSCLTAPVGILYIESALAAPVCIMCIARVA